MILLDSDHARRCSTIAIGAPKSPMNTTAKAHPPVCRPLSLRELFVLMTLACALAAVLCLSLWSMEERWLLGLTIGGTLLGNLVARSLSWRGWPLGLALGSVGAIAGTCLALYQAYQLYGSPVGLSDVAQRLWGIAILGGLIALLLALLAQLAFVGLLWITSSESSGAAAQVGRHPWRAVATVGLLAALVVLGLNLELLLWPHALPVRAAIEFEENGTPLNLQSGWVDLALSRDGRQLALSFELEWPDDADRADGRTWVYDVSGVPRRIELSGFNPRYLHRLAFDSESNRLALLDREGDQPARVVDVNTGQLYPPLKSSAGEDWLFVQRMKWLPGGQLALEEDDETPPSIFAVDTGRLVHRDPTGKPAADDSAPDVDEVEEPPREMIRYEPRFDHEYRLLEGKAPKFGAADYVALRVYRLTTRELLWDIKCDITSGDPATISPDGRFLMQSTATGPALLNIKQREFQSLTGSNWTFGSRGHVVHSNVGLDGFGFRENHWPLFVPFVRHAYEWWNGARVCWLDPDSGWLIARTAAVSHSILNVVISHDGSTVAAATWNGVYVFDVPPQLR